MTINDQELAALYDRYAHIVYRRCLSILRNEEDAHDAVQETFARVIRNHDDFRGHASPLTWMYKISTNFCLNQLRNGKGRRDKLDVRQHELGPEPLPGATNRLDEARIMRLLEQCDDETRACVMHTFFDECTRQEVADLVGLSVPTVRKRIEDFLELARTELGVPAENASWMGVLLGVPVLLHAAGLT
jgi:RNA polymerase sigma-70 factor, ECF subfamily